eukprot:jgi/Chrzof1/9649/Cz04g10280.t1
MAKITGSFSVLGLIIFGTANSLLGKLVYQLKGEGIDGSDKLFRKPWATTTLMFMSMVLCLPISFILERRKKANIQRTVSDHQEPLLTSHNQSMLPFPDKTPAPSIKDYLLLCIPTMFDLIATTLMNVGLLYVAASVFQMLRGAEMVFAALFSVVFLKRPLNKWHYGGIALCMGGIATVGASRLLAEDGDAAAGQSPQQAAIGMLLIVASQAVQAGQITVEDYFMSDMGIDPLKVVGYEGVFGTILMVGAALPLVHHLPGEEGAGIHEDSLDTLHMIQHSTVIQIALAGSAVAVLGYNIAGMFVTEEIGAAARTVLETMRTLFVWVAGLALFYTPVGHGKVGEAWDQYSWMQAAGFVVLVLGTLTYDKGTTSEEHKAHQQGKVMPISKWASLKTTLNIHTGHPVAKAKFRAAAQAVLAGVRMQNAAQDLLAGEAAA